MNPELKAKVMYYSVRVSLLEVSFICLAAWAYFGFDSTTQQLFYEDCARASFHWSTAVGLLALAYCLAVNFQVGGIRNLRQLRTEIRRDIRSIPKLSMKEYEGVKSVVDPFLALMVIVLVPLFALFLFEVPYSFLLDYFQFNSLFFPIYYSPLMVERNFSFLIAPAVISVFALKRYGKNGFRYRIDRWLAIMLFLTVIVFLIWVYYPSSSPVQTEESLGLSQSETWVMPKQQLFPQTAVSYLNVSRDTFYQAKNLFFIHTDEWPVHLLNVVSKYLVFLSVGYLFMVKVKKNEVR